LINMDSYKLHSKDKVRLTRKQKEAHDFAWYKDKARSLDVSPTSIYRAEGNLSESHRMKVNYDLVNNILDLRDFDHICKPFGENVGEMPVTMVNRDIISPRVKAMSGMEMKNPFNYRLMATNRDATTRKETEETDRIREYVLGEIVGPIRTEIETKYAQQTKGQELTQEEIQRIQAAIDEEVKGQTPDRVRNYMERKHQDPSEVMHHQLLQYLVRKEECNRKFNKSFTHSITSAYNLHWVGILKGQPRHKVINPLYFRTELSPDHDFIEEGEWATYEYWMYPSEVVSSFDLTDKEIDTIYQRHGRFGHGENEGDLFRMAENSQSLLRNPGMVRVLHSVWKDLRKIGFLAYNSDEEVLYDIVDESYVFDENNGDIEIEWEWLPETYETYTISEDIYKNMQAIPGQFKDIYNLYVCKLPYHGHITDNLNSTPTCPVDRMKISQYLVNIAFFRLETLLASDKGKKIMMNINAIPESAGMDIKKWQYFFETTPFAWFNPNEEGVGYNDVNTMAKVLDLSLVSDIGKYIDIITYLDQSCGKSVGLNDAVLGEVSPSQEVGNTKQQIVQMSNILQPYYDMHNHVKKNVLLSLLECAKVAYTENDPGILSYVLDDMSIQTFKVDQGLLSTTSIGLFIENSSNATEIKETLQTFAQAALQTQKAELSDVLSIIRQEGSQEAEEILKAAEQRRREEESSKVDKQIQAQKEEAEAARKHVKETWAHEEKMLRLEEQLKTNRELAKQLVLSAGFNEDKDMDNDGVLDIVELAKNSTNAQIDARKLDLEEKKFDHQKQVDKEQLKIDKNKK
jgi:hypothetical protein